MPISSLSSLRHVRPRRVAGAVAASLALGVPGAAPAVAGRGDVPAGGGRERVERVRWLMGTRCSVVVEADSGARARTAARLALDEIARVESILSTWRPDTPLALANAGAAERPISLGPELTRWIEEALVHARRTGGAFDPVVGSLVDAWDLRGDGRVPTRAELAAARHLSGHELAEVVDGRLRLSRAGAWIDPGAIGKGQALDAAARLLRSLRVRRAVIDFGGQVLVVGDVPTSVEIADPRARDSVAASLRLSDLSVATSSQSQRVVRIDGVDVGHVIDPRSGRPVPGSASVSVASRSAAEADALATALLVMDAGEAGRWLEGRPTIAAARMESAPGGIRLRATQPFLALLETSPTKPDGAPPPQGFLSIQPWTPFLDAPARPAGVIREP